MTRHNLIASEVSLEARSLRVTLRLECGSEDHPIFLELSAPDPRSFLEAKLPAALATVAPKTLHQLLESLAEFLRDAHRQEVSSGLSLVQGQATPASLKATTGAGS